MHLPGYEIRQFGLVRPGTVRRQNQAAAEEESIQADPAREPGVGNVQRGEAVPVVQRGFEEQERQIMLDLVRVTETAALLAGRLMGVGEKEKVDAAAVDGMRGMLELVGIAGTVVIGEGEKDRAPMLYIGEKVGNGGRDWGEVDIAVDPVEGTRLVANGLPNALSVIVVAQRGSLAEIPAHYMNKIAVGPHARGCVDIQAPVRENVRVVAAALGRQPRDLTVVILDRPRHAKMIQEVRATAARIKLISDGDVAAGIATCLEDSGVDMLMGIGGAPEAVLAAAAIRCLGGEFQGQLWCADETERTRLESLNCRFDQVLRSADLVRGESVIFSATGITDGDLLRGVRYQGARAVTDSLVMRMRTGTVRRISTLHDLRHKTLRSRQAGREVSV